MLKILSTKEVAGQIGLSVRRTQELIGEGNVFPRLEVRENGRLISLGVRPEVLKAYKATRKRK